MMNLAKRIFRQVGSAIGDFHLIEEGDRILVCLSGGKDSWVLLSILESLQKKAPVHFTIEAIKVDYPLTREENARIAEACASKNMPFTLISSDIGRIIANHRNEGKSHCSFCARLRRGFIYREAEKRGFNKIALGHHREDTNETLLLNMFFSGTLWAMPPMYRNDDDTVTVIRPLIRVSEDDIREYAKALDMPIIPETCPFSDDRERAAMKALLDELSVRYPRLPESLLAAQGNVSPSHLHDPGLCRHDPGTESDS
jgi:tRNA 2-thiocytidine biosynthesis protein TtcA